MISNSLDNFHGARCPNPLRITILTAESVPFQTVKVYLIPGCLLWNFIHRNHWQHLLAETLRCSCNGVPSVAAHPSVKQRKQVNIAAGTVPNSSRTVNSSTFPMRVRVTTPRRYMQPTKRTTAQKSTRRPVNTPWIILRSTWAHMNNTNNTGNLTHMNVNDCKSGYDGRLKYCFAFCLSLPFGGQGPNIPNCFWILKKLALLVSVC